MNNLLDAKLLKEMNKEINICKKKGGEHASNCVESIITKYLRKTNGTQKEHMEIAKACGEEIIKIFPFAEGWFYPQGR